jgi:hypothetical protein
MNPIFEIDTTFPPSLARLPVLAMLTQMGFWIVALLCLQWIYSILDDARDHPAHGRSYVGVVRSVKIQLLICAVGLTFPRLISLVAWGLLSPFWREIMSLLSWIILIPVATILARAWWRDRLARPAERLHVRHRFVEVTPPTVHEKTRGVLAFGLIIVIAFTTTYVRRDPTDVPAPPATVQRS